MKVTVIQATPDPIGVVSVVAATSHGKRDRSPKRTRYCLEQGHMSVFEHVSATFRIEGVSRACSHQLVRHRMASYCQLSQRYVELDPTGHGWYVTPPEVTRHSETLKAYQAAMFTAGLRYKLAIEDGLAPEDARYLLPEATCTELTMTVNFREFLHVLHVRDDEHAQWEVRELARLMKVELAKAGPGWAELLEAAERSM